MDEQSALQTNHTMKKLFSSGLLLASLVLHVESNAQSCCSQDEGWLTLASDKDFQASHEAPLPLNYKQEHGSMISFETLDGKPGNAFYLPSDQATDEVLIIFHEWWGLNDYIKMEAERLQKMLGNVDVYAVDLYDGKLAATPEEAGKLSKSLDAKRGETIIKGVLAKAGKNKEIATLGWCMGGSWAFTTALLADKQARACVMYYGFPEQDKKKIAGLKTDVLFIWGSQDKFITKNVVDEFQKEVVASGNKFTLHSYSADHAFANPSNPHHDAKATEDAMALTLAFLKERLRLE
jgi:carboxymethylenebutenolidase